MFSFLALSFLIGDMEISDSAVSGAGATDRNLDSRFSPGFPTQAIGMLECSLFRKDAACKLLSLVMVTLLSSLNFRNCFCTLKLIVSLRHLENCDWPMHCLG